MFPITHVVIIVKENHTFDNYFGAFPGANGQRLPHATDPHPDQPHDHGAWLRDQGASGGTKQQYLATDIPGYWAFAQQYTLCDNYFTDVATESEPNHLFLIAADSPLIDNVSAARTYQPQPPFDILSLPQTLEAAGHTWRNYAESHASYFPHIKALQGHRWNVPAAQFDRDLAGGSLPTVAWLYAPFGNSEHPGKQSVQQGAAWTAQKVVSIAKSPLWPSTAVIITWDDWGGWFDHVGAPLQSTWAGAGPAGYHGSQFRYGARVPCLIVSPYAKIGVNSHFYSHASVVKFCLRLFALPAWSAPALMANDPSGDLFESFDFTASPRLAVPTIVPA
ncbi:MAG: phospholipase C [Steroidobacteraceae bacterium]